MKNCGIPAIAYNNAIIYSLIDGKIAQIIIAIGNIITKNFNSRRVSFIFLFFIRIPQKRECYLAFGGGGDVGGFSDLMSINSISPWHQYNPGSKSARQSIIDSDDGDVFSNTIALVSPPIRFG
jgi:hypothetical protein